MPVNDELLARADRRLRPDSGVSVLHVEGDFKLIADLRDALRAALAARPQPDTEQVTAWLTEHRWRGRIMAAGGGYTWGIGDVLAAREAVAGPVTPTQAEENDGG